MMRYKSHHINTFKERSHTLIFQFICSFLHSEIFHKSLKLQTLLHSVFLLHIVLTLASEGPSSETPPRLVYVCSLCRKPSAQHNLDRIQSSPFQRTFGKVPLFSTETHSPGCSSLAYGAMEELGPFRVRSNGKTLYRNKFAWNHVANVLFLESPVGVGFSYSNTTSDYDANGDTKTAEDNYVFLLNWFERFPEYKGRDFYISGESYAGHYVPQLAHAILQHNTKPKSSKINLKGIIIGNAVINDETDLKAMYEYFWTHAVISDQVRNDIMGHCNFAPNTSNQSLECNSAADQVEIDIQYLDVYNIYAPVCHSTNLTLKPKKLTHELDPCSDHYVTAYMNNPEVQKALHANVTKLYYDWQPCSAVISNWADSPSTVIPILKELMAKNLRVWIYSGDTDGRIPVTSTRESLNKMGLQIKTEWHPWFIKGEVGGYTQVYEGNLTFATVRGAGHQVPSFQPIRGLAMISHFLSGTPLPNTSRTKMY